MPFQQRKSEEIIGEFRPWRLVKAILKTVRYLKKKY